MSRGIKKKAKSNSLIMKSTGIPTIGTSYTDTLSFEQKPISDTFLANFSKHYTNYYRDPKRYKEKNGLRIDEFPIHYGMPRRTFYNLVERSEILRLAYEAVKDFIAIRRENGMCYNELNFQATAFMMGKYDEEWDAETKRREAAKLDKDKHDKTIVIQMEKFPNVDSVPEKE